MITEKEYKEARNLVKQYKRQLRQTAVSDISINTLHSELSKQPILYSNEKDIDKVNQANWRMTALLNEICSYYHQHTPSCTCKTTHTHTV